LSPDATEAHLATPQNAARFDLPGRSEDRERVDGHPAAHPYDARQLVEILVAGLREPR
jgi:hypothetical protein